MNELKNIFINLSVLSKLKKGDKISIQSKIITIDNPNSILTTLLRTYNQDNREKSLERISSLITEAIKCSENAMKSNDLLRDKRDITTLNDNQLEEIKVLKEFSKNRDEQLGLDNISLIRSLVEAMNNTKNGIIALKETYEADISLCSQFDQEIVRIDNCVRKLYDYVDENGE